MCGKSHDLDVKTTYLAKPAGALIALTTDDVVAAAALTARDVTRQRTVDGAGRVAATGQTAVTAARLVVVLL